MSIPSIYSDVEAFVQKLTTEEQRQLVEHLVKKQRVEAHSEAVRAAERLGPQLRVLKMHEEARTVEEFLDRLMDLSL